MAKCIHPYKILAVALFLVSACANGSDVGKEGAVIELSGLQLSASAVALEDFKHKGYPLAHYKVLIVERGAKHEVTFVPLHPEGKPATRGGRTAFGEEIRYTVSESGVIEDVGYGR